MLTENILLERREYQVCAEIYPGTAEEEGFVFMWRPAESITLWMSWMST